jgi:ABC-type Fe3+ transport system permease subunit
MWENIKSFVVFYHFAYPVLFPMVVGAFIYSIVRGLWEWIRWGDGFWEEFFESLILFVVGFTCIALIIVFYKWLIHQFT